MSKIKVEQNQIRLDSQRREFITKSTLLGAGLVASCVLPDTAIATGTEPELKPETSQKKGYQLTQHVIDYYKSAAS